MFITFYLCKDFFYYLRSMIKTVYTYSQESTDRGSVFNSSVFIILAHRLSVGFFSVYT